jgi:succinyl-CoA synthetase beta subunit
VDIVARGVIKACLELGYDPAEKIAIFRIPGAWEEEGFKILEKYGIEYADRSVSMHEAARRAVAKACGLAKLVLTKPGVDKIAVMMSIVSNTRVDIVARGVIKACLELGYDPAEKITIFRIPGAWEEEGFKILRKYGVKYADRSVSLHEASRMAVEAMA